MEDQIKKFNDSHENIDIDLTVITENYANMMTMAYSAGTAPDLATISAGSSGFDLKTFVDGGLVVPLTDYIGDSDYQVTTDPYNNIVEGVNAIDGKAYWIPTALRSGVRMIYNQNLLDEIGYEGYPTTLKELMDLSDELAKAGNGQYYGLGTTSSAPIVRWFEGVCQMSGILPYDYKTGRFNFDDFKEPIEIGQQIFKNNSIFPGSPSQGVDAMRAQFAEGTFGIWANASQEAGVFSEQFPISKFDWVVKDLPTLNNEVKGSLYAKPQKGYLLFSSCEHPDEAWEVVKFFASEDFLKGYLENGYALPNTEYMSDAIDKAKIGRTADWSLKPYEGIYPAMPVISLAGEPFRTVIWKAVMNQVDADKAITDLNTRYNAALDRDIKMGKIRRIIIKDFDPTKPSKGTITYSDK
jgi:multiple sugar transport system substrate-binding protein